MIVQPETIDFAAFANMNELKEYLQKYTWKELETVCFRHVDGSTADSLKIEWVETTLSDGSTIKDVQISTS